MSFSLKNDSLIEFVYLFIRCNKNKFFLRNINNTDRNGVNKQKTQTKDLEKDNIGKAGGVQLWAWMLLKFGFLAVQEKQVMTSTPFLTWDLSRNRKQPGFFKKMLYDNKLKVKKISLNVAQLLQKLVLSRTWNKVPAILKISCSFWD